MINVAILLLFANLVGDGLEVVVASLVRSMDLQSFEAKRDLPPLELSLKQSKSAKIDPSLSSNTDTRSLDFPNGQLSGVQRLIAAKNKNAKEEFIELLTERFEETTQTLTLGPKLKLQMFHLGDGVEVGKAGLLLDERLMVVQVLNEHDFLGKTQSSKYEDTYLFRGWDTTKLKDGGRLSMMYEPAMCLANESYGTAIGSKRTVLVVQRIPAKILEDAIAKVERETPKLQPSREWAIGKDSNPANARLIDFDKKTITLQFDDGSKKVVELSQLSPADKSYVLKQRQFNPKKEAK